MSRFRYVVLNSVAGFKYTYRASEGCVNAVDMYSEATRFESRPDSRIPFAFPRSSHTNAGIVPSDRL